MAISAPTSFATSWALPIRAPGQRSGVASSAIAGSADMMQFACSARGNAVEPSARRRMKIGGASSARRGAGQPAAPSVALHSKRRAAAGDFAAPAVASARVAGAGGCEIEPKSLPHGGGPLGDRRPRRGAHRHPKSEPAKRAFGDAFVNSALNFCRRHRRALQFSHSRMKTAPLTNRSACTTAPVHPIVSRRERISSPNPMIRPSIPYDGGH